MPIHLGSGYLPEPAGLSMPWSGERCRAYAAAPPPVSSLLKRMNRIERSVCTSGELKMRASSITSAVPEPSSFAAEPNPWPSMCAPTMYISCGRVVPIFVQYTSSRGPGVSHCALMRRSAVSGWRSGFVFTPVRAV